VHDDRGAIDDLDDLDDLEDLEGPVAADPEVSPPHGDALAAATDAEEAFVTGGDTVTRVRLLSFYDRLRGRVVGALERRGGRVGRGAADALMLVPDVFMLLVRLALDPKVPAPTRGLIGGAIAYFVLPFDFLPEALVGGFGYMDDLVLAAAVLTQALGPDLEPRARLYWSGREELRRVLGDVVGAAQSLLGESLYGRLERLLARRGVALSRASDPAYGERAFDGFEGDPGSELA
jgi:uncharacterized membrane protein YkvA (DUF1232 family)